MTISKKTNGSCNPKRWQPRVYWRDDLPLLDESLELMTPSSVRRWSGTSEPNRTHATASKATASNTGVPPDIDDNSTEVD